MVRCILTHGALHLRRTAERGPHTTADYCSTRSHVYIPILASRSRYFYVIHTSACSSHRKIPLRLKIYSLSVSNAVY
jgi:hypothetical protein